LKKEYRTNRGKGDQARGGEAPWNIQKRGNVIVRERTCGRKNELEPVFSRCFKREQPRERNRINKRSCRERSCTWKRDREKKHQWAQLRTKGELLPSPEKLTTFSGCKGKIKRDPAKGFDEEKENNRLQEEKNLAGHRSKRHRKETLGSRKGLRTEIQGGKVTVRRRVGTRAFTQLLLPHNDLRGTPGKERKKG